MPRIDEQAPTELLVEIKDAATGQVWGTIQLKPKAFATGSRGFLPRPVTNPQNAEARYQCNLQNDLVGSKTEVKAGPQPNYAA